MAITTAQFAADIAQLLVAQGVPLDDATAFADSFAASVTEWLGGEDAIPADLAYRLTEVLGKWNTFITGMVDFLTMPADGGVNGDGTFPVTDQFGVVHILSSRAKLAQDLTLAQGALEGAEQLIQSAEDAQQSADAALGSANAAAQSLSDLNQTLATAVAGATLAASQSAAAAAESAADATDALTQLNDTLSQAVGLAVAGATQTATEAAEAAIEARDLAAGASATAGEAAALAGESAEAATTAAGHAASAKTAAEAARDKAKEYRDQAGEIASFDPTLYALKPFAKRQAKRAALIYGS